MRSYANGFYKYVSETNILMRYFPHISGLGRVA